MDQERVYFLGAGHAVTAVTKRDGVVVWRTVLPSASAATSGSSVVLAASSLVAGDEDVFGLDPLTGEIRWRFTPPEGRRLGRWIMAARGDTVITGSSSGHVFAIEASSGAELWRVRLPDALAPSGLTTDVFDPAIVGEQVFAAFTARLSSYPFYAGGVVALAAHSGAIQWVRSLPEPYSTPSHNGAFGVAVSSTIVAAWSLTGHVYGFDRNDGTLRWTVGPDAAVLRYDGVAQDDFRPLVTSGDRFVIGSGLRWVTGVAAATGQQLWRTRLPLGGTGLHLWANSGTVYLPHIGGQVTALDPATGAIRWQLNDGAFQTTVGMAFDGDRWFAGDGITGAFSAAR